MDQGQHHWEERSKITIVRQSVAHTSVTAKQQFKQNFSFKYKIYMMYSVYNNRLTGGKDICPIQIACCSMHIAHL